jgi:endoglucanase
MKKTFIPFLLFFVFIEHLSPQVFVNQAGYIKNLPKSFYTTVVADSFFIIDQNTNNILFKDELLFSAVNDPATGLTLYRGDFTDFELDGNYKIKVGLTDTSVGFSISSSAFTETFEKSLKGFYFQRCGIPLLQNNAGLFYHPPCHTSDGYFHTSTNQSGYKQTTGGWHDAGDYGKYVVNAGITIGTLQMAFEYFPSKFSSDNLNIPESGNNIPDILDEVRFELEWILKMQNENGGVYFKLTKPQFESFIMPNNDSGIRYIYELSSNATADFVAIMARAARLFEPYDDVFADQCLNAAILGWNYLLSNPTIVPPGGFINPAGTSTGQYGDVSDSDERLWAAAELFETTGLSDYHNYFIANYNSGGLINSTQWWGNVKNFALITYLKSLQSSVSSTIKTQIKNTLISYCNSLVNRVSTNGFGVTINPGEYIWGSNSDVLNKAMLLIYGYEETGNINYYEAALMQLNYILGCNAHNLSFLTGVGTNSVLNPHHRPSASDGVIVPVPGLLAGGPDQYLDDPTLQSLFNSSTPPALCYVDDVDSYASNEIAINWNAPLVFVSGYFNGEGVTNVESQGSLILPKSIILNQNYPNPFNPDTKISWESHISGWQTLKVFDSLGNEIETIVDEFLEAGFYSKWFKVNPNLTSGVYFYRLETGGFSNTKKMLLLK